MNSIQPVKGTQSIADFIGLALKEDVGIGDQTSLACINPNATGRAILKAKENGVIAGLVLADQIFNYIDPILKVKTIVADGSNVNKDMVVLEVQGNVRSILKAERLVLNCMQRMSGIATFTKAMVDKIAGTNAKILDTRKTTPNFRLFEKWAVQLGGGFNHRFGLYDMILIKDNHIHACGGITQAIQKATIYNTKNKKDFTIEIETKTIEEVNEVLRCGGVNRIMLDNFTPIKLKEAINIINKKYETEASGGINMENILDYASTGVDYISVGALTHSYKSLDLSLKMIN
jgi:nicotinate-nucleotide pyrophosphorylase (carboxylating)